MIGWNETYAKTQQPDLTQIETFIASPLWPALCTKLETAYGVQPRVEHSTCSGAPGWNVKYKKSGRALCTLYPRKGYFTCLICLGAAEAPEVELLLGSCTEYVQQLYTAAKPMNGCRWLMVDITDEATLADLVKLIACRVRVGRKS